MVPVLRPYQQKIVNRVDTEFRSGVSRIALQLATGGGKTVIFVSMIADAVKTGARVLVLAHRREIIEQISETLTRFGVPHGIIAAGTPETDHAIQVASVASIARRLDRWADKFDLVVIDEAHHAVAGSWAKVIASQSRARLLGVTATPERLDGRGLGDIFESLVLGPPVADLIALEALCAARIYVPAAAPDMSGARTRGGDYAVEDMRARMGGVVITAAVREYHRICPGLPAVAFCVDIQHSQDVAAAFRAAGYRAAHVDGDTPADDRRAMIAALGTGELDVLCNCGLISEGVDVPVVTAAILLRPTQSLALYLQQIGRVLRPAPGKESAIVLDFAGNSTIHGLPDEPRTWSLESKRRDRKGMGEPVVRRCEECGAINYAASRTCCECGASLLTRRERAEIEIQLAEAERARLVEEIREMSYRNRLEWAGNDEGRLHQIARACGYKKGWVFHIITERRAAQ